MLKYINILFFAGMILMNYLANSLPLNNKTTGQLSDSYPNLFVPAGITFSIWGIIYALLAGYCIVQFTRLNLNVPVNVGWLFAASCILNALWIVCWHYEKLPLSLIVMLGMLIVLIYINILIKDLPFNIIKASFGIYLGWICIATIANVTALLVHYEWKGSILSEEVWTITMISIGAIIAVVTIYKINNPFVGLAVMWALAGIIIKRQSDFKTIVIISIVAIIVIGGVTVAGFLKKSIPGMG